MYTLVSIMFLRDCETETRQEVWSKFQFIGISNLSNTSHAAATQWDRLDVPVGVVPGHSVRHLLGRATHTVSGSTETPLGHLPLLPLRLDGRGDAGFDVSKRLLGGCESYKRYSRIKTTLDVIGGLLALPRVSDDVQGVMDRHTRRFS